MNYAITIDGYEWDIFEHNHGYKVYNKEHTNSIEIKANAAVLFELYLEQRKNGDGEIKTFTDADLIQLLDLNCSNSNIRKLRQKIIEKLCSVYERGKVKLPVERFFGTNTVGRTAFKHKVVVIYHYSQANPARKYALKRKELESASDTELYNILGALLEVYPQHKSEFYRTEEGSILPFIKLGKRNNASCPFSFPLKVTDRSKAMPVNRKDSLYQQRIDAGNIIYNGSILQLRSEQKKYELAWTSYNDILDSCDYIPARIKEYWTKLDREGLSFNKKVMQIKALDTDIGLLSNVWHQRFAEVVNDDFSNYLAGIAFSIPLFKVSEEGERISLLCAKGSSLKASGAGKKHVCPAGMLEFFNIKPPTLFSMEDFKAVCVKELLEETLFGGDNKLSADSEYKAYVDIFSSDRSDKVRNEYQDILKKLQDIILPNWKEIWEEILPEYKKTVPSTSIINNVLNIDSNEEPWFLIVDALCFRPEIIKPLYFTDDYDCFLNWENDEKMIESWTSQTELDTWIDRNKQDFCAPGIASIYLGGSYFFKNRASVMETLR